MCKTLVGTSGNFVSGVSEQLHKDSGTCTTMLMKMYSGRQIQFGHFFNVKIEILQNL
jgi:hypothetical protein